MPKLPRILERVKRCHFCRREMACSAAQWRQNPFCTTCLPQRLPALPTGSVTFVPVGHYFALSKGGKNS